MNGTLIEMGYKQYRTINKCHTKRKKDMYVLFSFFLEALEVSHWYIDHPFA